MKKAILVLSMILLACSYNATAQNYSYFDEAENNIHTSSDGFFQQNTIGKRTASSDWGTMPLLPQTHGYHYDYPAWIENAPVGSGWLLLAGMGLGYAAIRRKKNKQR